MGVLKSSYPPLLGPGRHRLTVPQLRALCVGRFTASVSRPQLFAEFERLIAYLQASTLICEVWVNGSYICEKGEPDDIDASIAFMAEDAERLELADPIILADIMTRLNGGFQFSPVLDTYLCPRFPKNDPRRGADMEDYWAGKWGKDWDGWLKGFAVIEVGKR